VNLGNQFRNLDLKWSTKLTARGPHVVSSKSASQMGQSIRSTARAFLMVLSEEDKQEGLAWRHRAPALLGQSWDRALEPDSKLPECVRGAPGSSESTQGLLSAMLSLQPGDPSDRDRLVYWDVHDKLSVCGAYKPDIIGAWGAMLATATGVIVDIKNQFSEYLSNKNIHQVRKCVVSFCPETAVASISATQACP